MINMTFDPKCFLSFARTLLDNDICDGEEDKVKFCTIMNRSYYAVFLRIRDILEKEHLEPPQERGEHHRIQMGLINQMGRADLVQTLKTLKKDRIKADYTINHFGNKSEDFKRIANGSSFSADYLLNELKSHNPQY